MNGTVTEYKHTNGNGVLVVRIQTDDGVFYVASSSTGVSIVRVQDKK